MTKVGNPNGRCHFVLGAHQLRKIHLEYKAFHWRKNNQVSKYQHKRALVLTTRKLVRLVRALLTVKRQLERRQTEMAMLRG